jgi:anti-sigma factor RsiW
MKSHLKEKHLIEYQFKLTSENQMGKISAHLATCDYCHERLQRLTRKFAALDLLSSEVRASEDLISRTVEQACQPARPMVLLHSKPAWIGAAAVVLLLQLLSLAPIKINLFIAAMIMIAAFINWLIYLGGLILL